MLHFSVTVITPSFDLGKKSGFRIKEIEHSKNKYQVGGMEDVTTRIENMTLHENRCWTNYVLICYGDKIVHSATMHQQLFCCCFFCWVCLVMEWKLHILLEALSSRIFSIYAGNITTTRTWWVEDVNLGKQFKTWTKHDLIDSDDITLTACISGLFLFLLLLIL